MSEKNSVSVKIYGQEYAIAGDTPREYIMRLADYVDGKMSEIGKLGSISMSAIAVLSAVNITDEMFKKDDELVELTAENLDLHEKAEKYERMWEELKQSFSQYKEETSGAASQRDELQRQFLEKEVQTSKLLDENSALRAHAQKLSETIDQLNYQIENTQSAPEAATEMINQLEAKCRDIESSFYDIQIENIHLKNELEALRKKLD